MYNAYMLTSKAVQKVYMFWVKRWYHYTYEITQWTPEYEQAHQQIARMQRMYDSLEDGKIVYLWHWHKIALDEAKNT
jgi:hypothetical protein